MKYERLTEKAIGCFGYDLKDFEHKPKEFNDYDAFYAYKTAVGRLGELEDKIENGEIDYVADRDKEIEFFAKHNARVRKNANAEIARLTAENAALQKRLDNAVELPVKVGDTVYWVEDDPNIDGICEFTVQGFSFSTNNNDGLRVIIGTFLEPCVDYYKNKQLFFDRSEAEARLAELKGGRE